MSVSERVRLAMFSRVKSKELSVAEAGRKLGLSLRQAYRVWKGYRERGDAGLIHGLRGRAGNAAKVALRARVVQRYRERYRGFNAAHAAEKLAGDDLAVSRQTLWRWLDAEGLVPQPRRGSPHRQRRTPKACVGEMVQMDGSTHDWLLGRGPACVLFVLVDDASGQVFGRFYASEDTTAAFDVFGRYVRQHGLPLSLYVDKDSIYRVNDPLAREHGRQRGQMPVTQFGRAMKALGVQIICANSPQAKGRVERMNGTLQDRLVQELKLAGIGDLAAANAFLEQRFLPEFNHQFAHPPACGTNLHRKVPAGVQLAEVLCEIETRTVGRDWCIRWANRILQLDERHAGLRLAGQKVQVQQHAEGTLQVVYRGQRLRWREVSGRPVAKPVAPLPPGAGRPWRPGPDHPWKNLAVKAAPLRSVSRRSPALRSAALTATP
jgi:transposase